VTEIKLLIVDDLEHVRQGLRTILELAGGLKVLGEACDGLEAIQQVEQLQPDVVLMDLAIPDRRAGGYGTHQGPTSKHRRGDDHHP
jgi:DNA-binding NarL/FixJ family response regulator